MPSGNPEHSQALSEQHQLVLRQSAMINVPRAALSNTACYVKHLLLTKVQCISAHQVSMPEALGLQAMQIFIAKLKQSCQDCIVYQHPDNIPTITRLGIRVPAAAYCSYPVTYTSNSVEGLIILPRLH